jgi:hypothetical protein
MSRSFKIHFKINLINPEAIFYVLLTVHLDICM